MSRYIFVLASRGFHNTSNTLIFVDFLAIFENTPQYLRMLLLLSNTNLHLLGLQTLVRGFFLLFPVHLTLNILFPLSILRLFKSSGPGGDETWKYFFFFAKCKERAWS